MDANSTSCRAPPKQVNQCVYAYVCVLVCVCMYRTAVQYHTFSDIGKVLQNQNGKTLKMHKTWFYLKTLSAVVRFYGSFRGETCGEKRPVSPECECVDSPQPSSSAPLGQSLCPLHCRTCGRHSLMFPHGNWPRGHPVSLTLVASSTEGHVMKRKIIIVNTAITHILMGPYRSSWDGILSCLIS